jgi:triacylglycerol lipase
MLRLSRNELDMKKKGIGLLLALAMFYMLPSQLFAQSSAASLSSSYTQTRYPIVLVHGLFGFDSIGPVEYFYGIPAALRSGGASVYVTQVSAANSTEVRGEQLLTQVKQILAATGASKVNLMGHSHGAPTARYVASVRPDLVASVTSIGGVNQGAPFADVILSVAPPGSLANAVIVAAVNSFAQFLNGLSNQVYLPQNSLAAAQSLSTAGSAKFNQAHPWGVPTSACGEGAYNARGVAYYSWGGAQTKTNFMDPLDDPLNAVSILFWGAKNDGLVSSCSSHLGMVIRDDYRMNHADLTNQTTGLVAWNETNPTTVYRLHANRLKIAGY